MDRLIIGCSEVGADQYKAGTLTSTEMTAVDIGVHEIEQTKLLIDDFPYCNMGYIRRTARKRKREGKCDLIIIDYLQLIEPDKSAGSVREQQISMISRGLKALAKDLDVPIIVLSQLSRDVEKRGGTRMPQLSDLRDSGAIEQDADMVIFPYRPAYYEEMSNSKDENGLPLKGCVKLIVSKNRNGRTLDVDAYHNESMTFFSDSRI
ncbi:DnaB-like helicase C-terminal domain-containing protein [Ancylomarina euxinus]|nr:DnaB-like helicase C-terminal domain-containing protein [Ancylomarina euxinus]